MNNATSFKRTVYVLGWTFLVASVVLVRFSNQLWELFANYPWLRELLFTEYRPGIFEAFPATFLPALALLVSGICAISYAVGDGKGNRPQLTTTSSPAVSNSTLVRDALLLVLGVGCLSFFFVMDARDHLEGPWNGRLFLLVGFLGLAIVLFRDRSAGVDLGVHLSIREGLGLILFALGACYIYSLGFNSWRYSFIGDEYGFYWFAEGLLPHLSQVNLLEGSGCFEFFPVFLSAWQAWFMYFLGPDNFSWRLSMAVLVVLCLPPVYLCARMLASKVTTRPVLPAFVACSAVFLSELVIVWARIGKPHASFLPPIVFAPCFYLAGRRRKSSTYFFLAGASAGLGLFLSTLGPLIAIATVGMLFLVDAFFDLREKNFDVRHGLHCLALLASGFLICGAPILAQVDYLQHVFGVTITSTEAQSNRHLFVPKIFQSILMFFTFRAHNHFLSDNVLDPISAILLAGGIAISRRLGGRLSLGLFGYLIVASVFAGAISQYPYPPVTRMFVAMVPLGLFLGVSYGYLTARLSFLSPLVALTFVSTTAYYNYVKLEDYNPYRRGIEYSPLELRKIQESPVSQVHCLVFPDSESPYFLRLWLQTYHVAQTVLFFQDNQEGISQLERYLASRHENVLVRVFTTSASIPQVRSLVEKYGAQYDGEIVGGIPSLPAASPSQLRYWMGTLAQLS